MKANNTLVFFTLQYPYGQKSETFIENEIPYLAEKFEQIIIIPRENNNDFSIRKVPKNVLVNDILINHRTSKNHFKYIFSSFRTFRDVTSIYFQSLITDKSRKFYLSKGYYIYYLANMIQEAYLLKDFINSKNLNEAVYYDYWFVNSTLSLAYLKSKNHINAFICRAHGFDVFDDRWDCGSVPFREYIFKKVKKVYTISSFNRDYILKKISNNKHKLEVEYLGVKAPEIISPSIKDDCNEPFLIVSCANLYPFKQIQNIPKILNSVKSLDRTIKWVHFGDGQCEEQLLSEAKNLDKNIVFEYKGHVKNSKVIEFYKNNRVNLFLSLSLKEGLPVSMMEAQSFGVPIMANNIFGIPEIVNSTTGVLLESNWSDSKIANQITKIITGDLCFNQDEIKDFFNKRFNAKNNYKTFTVKLIEG